MQHGMEKVSRLGAKLKEQATHMRITDEERHLATEALRFFYLLPQGGAVKPEKNLNA